MKSNKYLVKPVKHQQGVALAITLIMLVLITLLAVSGMRSTTLEERMASNSRNKNVAFQMAETALRYAEGQLQADPDAVIIWKGETQAVGFGGCEVELDSEIFSSQGTWDTSGCGYIGTADDNVPKSPQFFIEFMTSSTSGSVMLGAGVLRDCFYRVTSRGYGLDVNSTATLQTIYKLDTCFG